MIYFCFFNFIVGFDGNLNNGINLFKLVKVKINIFVIVIIVIKLYFIIFIVINLCKG